MQILKKNTNNDNIDIIKTKLENRGKIIVALITALGVVLAATIPVIWQQHNNNVALQDSNTSLQTEISDLKTESAETEDDFSWLQEENDSLTSENTTLKTENAKLQKSNDSLSKENSKLIQEKAELEIENTNLQAEIDNLKDQLTDYENQDVPNDNSNSIESTGSNNPQNLLNVCPPYESSGVSTPSTMKMMGETYSNGFVFNMGYSGYALFNLNGQYTELEFDFGHIDGSSMVSTSFNIYLDGQFYQTIEGSSEMRVTHYSIPLNAALTMKISFSGFSNFPYYGLANVMIS